MPDFLLPQLIDLLDDGEIKTPLMIYWYISGQFGELRTLLKVQIKQSSMSYKT